MGTGSSDIVHWTEAMWSTATAIDSPDSGPNDIWVGGTLVHY